MLSVLMSGKRPQSKRTMRLEVPTSRVPQMNSTPAKQAGSTGARSAVKASASGTAPPAFKQEEDEGEAKRELLRRGWHFNPAGQHPAGGTGDGGTCHHPKDLVAPQGESETATEHRGRSQ